MAQGPINDSVTDAVFAKMASEKQAITAGVGEALISWSSLEGCLLGIMCVAAFGRPINEVGSAIFYSATSFEARLRMVDAAVRSLHLPPYASDLQNSWAKLKGKIESKQKARNKIAHYSIVYHNNVTRLAPPIFDRKGYSNDPSQRPGMGSNELNSFCSSIGELCGRLVRYIKVFEKFILLDAEDDSSRESFENANSLREELKQL